MGHPKVLCLANASRLLHRAAFGDLDDHEDFVIDVGSAAEKFLPKAA